MIKDCAHRHPVCLDDDGEKIFVDTAQPVDVIEPLSLPADQAERDAALRAIRWMLEAIGVGGILMKICALRFLLHMESRSMEVVAEQYGFTRAAVSKYVTLFSDAFGMEGGKSRDARKTYSATQKRVWPSRREKALAKSRLASSTKETQNNGQPS